LSKISLSLKLSLDLQIPSFFQTPFVIILDHENICGDSHDFTQYLSSDSNSNIHQPNQKHALSHQHRYYYLSDIKPEAIILTTSTRWGTSATGDNDRSHGSIQAKAINVW